METKTASELLTDLAKLDREVLLNLLEVARIALNDTDEQRNYFAEAMDMNDTEINELATIVTKLME